MKGFILSILFFLMFCGVYGQVSNNSPKPYIPNIIPPSPDVAAMEKFGVIPVGYSTGVPNINYPIWSWKRNNLEFSIGLSYHAGGHKVQDMASNVGLGWTLNGLGNVTRTVKGVPDDKPIYGYINTDALPFLETYAHNSDGYYITSPFPSQRANFPVNQAITDLNFTPINSQLTSDIANNIEDGEQDVFSYSAGNLSGKFILDKNGNVVSLEKTNNIIQIIFSGNLIVGFYITNDKGIKYEFKHLEYQFSALHTVNGSLGTLVPNTQNNYVSGWMLTRIIDLGSQEYIEIIYENYNPYSKYETGFMDSESFTLTSALNGIQSHLINSSFSEISSNNPKPVLIKFPDGSNLNFKYDFSRDDFLNTKALTNIIIKNFNNIKIKEHKLFYGYFYTTSPPYVPIIPLWAISGNDYNKRLKLEKIEEISNNGLISKPTLFEYNGMLMNSRYSNNLDFWGYNINPSRNNLSKIPIIPLKQVDKFINGGGAYIGSASREPDEQFGKAAVLEKIIYPTGGYTSFEFECNKAFSQIDYYRDEENSNSPEWIQNQFGQLKAINFPSRTKMFVELYFKTEEFGPRPPYNPNQPQTCFEESQDLMPAKFEIYTQNGTIPIYTVNKPYGNFRSGVKEIVELPLNENYFVKFIYNSSQTCSFIYPFKAYINGKYFIEPHDKLVGGLRIKKITSNSGQGELLVKQYDYNYDNGNSSATLSSIPDFGYYKTTTDESHYIATLCGSSYDLMSRHIHINSNPGNTLNYHNGGPLVYKRVREIDFDRSLIERTYDPIITSPTGGPVDRYPYVPLQDFPSLSGLLLSEKIKDKFGNLKTESINTYSKSITSLLSTDPISDIQVNRNLVTGIVASTLGTMADPCNYDATYFLVYQYWWHVSDVQLLSTKTYHHENGEDLEVVKKYTYDPQKKYLKSILTTNSKNEQRINGLIYAYESVSNNPAYQTMVDKNMLNYVTISQEKRYPMSFNDALKQTTTNYALFQNTMPLPASIQSSILDNPLKTDITFNKYDNIGNILQYTAKDGIITSFIWGYKKQYPVAKIVGKSYDDVLSQSNIILAVINNPGNDTQMRTELDKLRNLQNCFVSTYTYEPLIGKTSETDERGVTIYYEYDNFNRLSIVRDKDQNIIKKICYNYTGQPEECAPNTTSSQWVNTGNIRCKPCPQNSSYPSNIREREEKDINPQSSTYGTIRWVEDGVGSCISPPSWSQISSNCQLDPTGLNTGYQVIIEQDVNPCSNSYNQTRQTTSIDLVGCPTSCATVCQEPKFKCINGNCEEGFWGCVKVKKRYREDGSLYWICHYRYCFSDGSVSNYILSIVSENPCRITCL